MYKDCCVCPPVNPEDMIQHLIEEHKRDVELFLIEDFQTGLHVIPQLLLFHWDVVLQVQANSASKWQILKILSRIINK